MALAKYPLGDTPIRGKISGTVLQTGKYGAVIKGGNHSQGQLLRNNLNAQEAMSHCATLFDQLTAPQKANWTAAIPDFPTVDRYGTPVLSSARDLFMRTVARLPIDRQTALATPRPVYTGPAVTAGSLSFDSGSLRYDPAVAPAGETLSASLFVSGPLSVGRTTSAPKMVRIHFENAYSGSTPEDITSVYEALFGPIPENAHILYCEEVYNNETPELLSEFCSYVETPASLPYVTPYSIAAFDLGLSIRLLNESYTGPLIQVTNQAGSVITDINPDALGLIDIATFQALYPSTQAYIKIFYDQSGNGYDFTNSSTYVNMYEIWDGSDFIRDPEGNVSAYNNSTTGVRYLGTNGARGLSNAADYMMSFSFQTNQTSAQQSYLINFSRSSAVQSRIGFRNVYLRPNVIARHPDGASVQDITVPNQLATGTAYQWSNIVAFIDAEGYIYINDVLEASDLTYISANPLDATDSQSVYFLGTAVNALNFRGYISEFLLYITDQRSNRSALNSNQLDYFQAT